MIISTWNVHIIVCEDNMNCCDWHLEYKPKSRPELRRGSLICSNLCDPNVRLRAFNKPWFTLPISNSWSYESKHYWANRSHKYYGNQGQAKNLLLLSETETSQKIIWKSPTASLPKRNSISRVAFSFSETIKLTIQEMKKGFIILGSKV